MPSPTHVAEVVRRTTGLFRAMTQECRLQGVGAGRVVANRYALRARRAHLGELEVWSAGDVHLERSVTLTILPTGHPRADGVLDAARRYAALTDPRLLRVYDAGSDGDHVWLVEEATDDTVTLADLLKDGPLPAAQARRVIGEVAEALAGAASRGLHHLHLSPHAVRLTADGRIKLAGVAIAAAVNGGAEPAAEVAESIDARGTLALGYAALTTRWPLDPPVDGVASAPRIVGGVAAPSEIAVGVPHDLDALCRDAFTSGRGPATPAELARLVAPWTPNDRQPPALSSTSERGRQDDTVVLPPVAVHPAGETATPGSPASSTEPHPPDGPRRPGQDTRLGTDPDAADDMEAGAAHGPVDEAVGEGGNAPVDQSEGPGVGARIGSFAHAASVRARALREQMMRSRAPAPPPSGDLPRPEPAGTSALPPALAVGQSETPYLFEGRPDRPDGAQSRFVLTLVAVLVVIALALALPTLLRSPAPDPIGPSTAARVVAPTGGSSGGPAPAGAVTGQIVPVASATGFDPDGDDSENDSAAALAHDGKDATSWRSEGYVNGPAFAGKGGVGVIFTLPAATAISSVTLSLPDQAQDVAVYAANRRSLTGAALIGSLTGATGTQVLAPAAATTPSRYVIVWFTRLAPDRGRYRSFLAEMTARA